MWNANMHMAEKLRLQTLCTKTKRFFHFFSPFFLLFFIGWICFADAYLIFLNWPWMFRLFFIKHFVCVSRFFDGNIDRNVVSNKVNWIEVLIGISMDLFFRLFYVFSLKGDGDWWYKVRDIPIYYPFPILFYILNK